MSQKTGIFVRSTVGTWNIALDYVFGSNTFCLDFWYIHDGLKDSRACSDPFYNDGKWL
jgi:hypothetical protein